MIPHFSFFFFKDKIANRFTTWEGSTIERGSFFPGFSKVTAFTVFLTKQRLIPEI